MDGANETRPVAWVGLLLGLVVSGAAGIVNQVIWQRALKIFLGGSETLSAMVVVLVFLLGLGVGAAVAGRYVRQLRNPLRVLAGVELALACGNAVVALILGLDITETVYAMQRLAVSSGVPLRAVYAACSTVLLLPPTLLMGATLPLASEGLQRQLHAVSARLVPVLFFVNTFGASFGAWAASAWLLPSLGQRRALFVAVACNALAGAAIGLFARLPDVAPAKVEPRAPTPLGLSREEVLGGLLGFLALGYEMVLFRLLALAHEPVPTTFATGLAGFLLAWSLGVAIAGRFSLPVTVTALASALLVAGAGQLYVYEAGLEEPFPLLVAVGAYVAPCFGFGWMYGQLVSRAATDWGRDVGRYSAVNTIGSCLGILFFTLVGYELPQSFTIGALALALVAVGLVELGGNVAAASTTAVRVAAGAVAAAAAGILVYGGTLPHTGSGDLRSYWGRDGVIDVSAEGNVYIDGLWHTALAENNDQVGTPYSWLMAFAALMAHDDPHPARALVIGGGIGISSGTLSGIDGAEIDVYEINHTLKRVLRDYPEGTLRAYNPPERVHWRWQDARTGLALDPTRYDIILSAPLYLRQAGSSLLLSHEYLRLVKSRLADDGVIAVYSNEGSDAQTRLVQATLASLFAHRVTWFDGLVTVASDHPITMTEDKLRERLALPDRIYKEARWLDVSLRAEGGLYGWYDGTDYTHVLADRVVTDDQPLIEYPDLADRWVGTVESP